MHRVRSSLIRDDLERMQREQQPRRELEKDQRRLADEVDRAVAQTRPSPWLKPWDPGYESATAIALRQAAEASSGRRCYDDFAANGVADGRDPAANPSWSVPARKPCWADCLVCNALTATMTGSPASRPSRMKGTMPAVKSEASCHRNAANSSAAIWPVRV